MRYRLTTTWTRAAALLLLLDCTARAAVPVVENGEARAVVITAQPPTATTQYAADELAYHVKRAAGVTLPVATEARIPEGYPSRIYVGDTKAARRQGLDVDALGPDVFVLKTMGSNVFIAGKESRDADPLDPGLDGTPNPFGGPLFGVYELLERDLGVRWLWPGELGTVVPRTDMIAIRAADVTVGPAFPFRLYRYQSLARAARKWPGREQQTVRRLAGYSAEGIRESVRELLVFLRRHRLGFSELTQRGGHGIDGVPRGDATFCARHPGFFGMDAQGRRGFGDPLGSGRVPHCVSNPELHRYVVDQGWDGGQWLVLGEVDSARYCHCPKCLAWDAPQEREPGHLRYIVSDRYARFWKTVYELAVKRNPEVKIAVLIYVNYFPAPLQAIQLNANIVGQFCPWGSLAQSPKAQWLGWRKTGIQLVWRPNDWCHHYAMPMPGTIRGGATEFFKFACQNGLHAFDYDSLQTHWVTRNPMLYIHMRWASKPGLTVDDILKEYYEAFGPAAGQVAEYVESWENYEYPAGRGRPNYMVMHNVHKAFPTEAFDVADALLGKALAAARGAAEPEYAQRVEFLMAGMKHARLASEFWATLDGGHFAPTGPGRRAVARGALSKLIAFRRANQQRHVADFWNAARDEDRNVGNIAQLLESGLPELATVTEGKQSTFEFDIIDTDLTGPSRLLGFLTTADTEEVVVAWGDGSHSAFSGSRQRLAKEYGEAATRRVRVYARDNSALTGVSMRKVGNVRFDLKDMPSGLRLFLLDGHNTVHGNIGELPASLKWFRLRGRNAIIGDVANLPAGMESFDVFGVNTVHGDIANLPKGLDYLRVWGRCALSGDLAGLPRGLTYLDVRGSNTIAGDLSGLPPKLERILLYGDSTVAGDIAHLPKGVRWVDVRGSCNLSRYTSGRKWAKRMHLLSLRPASGHGLDTEELDSLLVDLAQTTWGQTKDVWLAGSNAPRSKASAVAVRKLEAMGVNVETN